MYRRLFVKFVHCFLLVFTLAWASLSFAQMRTTAQTGQFRSPQNSMKMRSMTNAQRRAAAKRAVARRAAAHHARMAQRMLQTPAQTGVTK